MKLSLRYFVLACLLLGTIGVPWTWRTCQAWREAEIKRLEKELAKLSTNKPLRLATSSLGFSREVENTADRNNWIARVEQIRDRLEKLTGKRPERRPPATHDAKPLQGAPAYTVGLRRVEGPIDAATEAKMEEYLTRMRMSMKRMNTAR